MIDFFAKYCSIYKVWNKNNTIKWEHQKKAGMVQFILVEGILKWGILSSIIFLSITFIGKDPSLKEIITTCLIWLSASIIYGFSIWHGTSLAYKKQSQ